MAVVVVESGGGERSNEELEAMSYEIAALLCRAFLRAHSEPISMVTRVHTWDACEERARNIVTACLELAADPMTADDCWLGVLNRILDATTSAYGYLPLPARASDLADDVCAIMKAAA
jgi:hypothetical protein